MPTDEQKLSQIEVEILVNTPDSGDILLSDFQLGEYLLLGGRSFPDPNNYDPTLAARYLEGLWSLQRRGLIRHYADRLYTLTANGFDVRRQLLEERSTRS
jgi:hypothetical protein